MLMPVRVSLLPLLEANFLQKSPKKVLDSNLVNMPSINIRAAPPRLRFRDRPPPLVMLDPDLTRRSPVSSDVDRDRHAGVREAPRLYLPRVFPPAQSIKAAKTSSLPRVSGSMTCLSFRTRPQRPRRVRVCCRCCCVCAGVPRTQAGPCFPVFGPPGRLQKFSPVLSGFCLVPSVIPVFGPVPACCVTYREISGP